MGLPVWSHDGSHFRAPAISTTRAGDRGRFPFSIFDISGCEMPRASASAFWFIFSSFRFDRTRPPTVSVVGDLFTLDSVDILVIFLSCLWLHRSCTEKIKISNYSFVTSLLINIQGWNIVWDFRLFRKQMGLLLSKPDLLLPIIGQIFWLATMAFYEELTCWLCDSVSTGFIWSRLWLCDLLWLMADTVKLVQ